MKKVFVSIFCGVLFLSAQAQEKSSDQVLFTVANDTVKADEYKAVYNKNRDIGEDIDPKTPLEYLDLYINFKLKVHNAKELGKDTMPNFLREFRNYREQLVKPYLSDKDVTNELVREAYTRMKYDIKASHIMVKLDKNSSPDDTLVAYNKALSIRNKIVKDGVDFETLATSSDDTYSAERGGDLGFFTVFDMVYSFESAAYTNRIGELSMPVRSQYGYHLVKPTEKRDARGKVTVAHIMLIDNDKTTDEQRENVKTRIDEIFAKLDEGEEFETLVSQYSDDKTSIPRGGQLDPFGINKMYPEFENTSFGLESVGDYSQPIKTPVGWHILKLIKKDEKLSFEKVQAELKGKVERDVRAQQSEVSVMKRIKQDYSFKEYPKIYQKAFQQVNEESYNKGEWKVKAIKNADIVLFSFADKNYTIKDFLSFLEISQTKFRRGSSLDSKLYKAIKDYSDGELLSYEKSRLTIKYPEFRLLEREYFEGILLFDLTEEKVWRKAMSDTSGLKAFFEMNTANYQWPSRYQSFKVDASSKKICKKAIKLLKKNNLQQEVLNSLTENSKLDLAIDSGLYTAAELDLSSLSDMEEPGKTDIEVQNGRYMQGFVLNIEAPRAKTFKEAKGRVISDYQEFLEAQWLEDLKLKYPVIVNQTILDKVVSELE
jgi:peptidyl-prolyl cis-trans isomerase SurA